jgi:hypothetical protein
MPLSIERGRVACLREQLRKRDFPVHKPLRLAVDRDAVGAIAYRMASDHQRRARWRARGLDIEIGEACALASERIETRGWRAARSAAAVGPQLAVAEIVGEKEHDVRLPLRVNRSRERERKRRNAESLHGVTCWKCSTIGERITAAEQPGSEPLRSQRLFRLRRLRSRSSPETGRRWLHGCRLAPARQRGDCRRGERGPGC